LQAGMLPFSFASSPRILSVSLPTPLLSPILCLLHTTLYCTW
jgi:hypothetical protein